SYTGRGPCPLTSGPESESAQEFGRYQRLWIFSWKLNGKIFILQKFFDGKENVWEEDEEDSWSIDSFNLPDWLRRFL
ncbi:hypothetical protein, partial [Bifidobacterium adolescentis]|uniref:hypothetical protein n=1 Tax=Bifidobacterium adolescentis TaxID=1680 RepID=UPI001C8CB97F